MSNNYAFIDSQNLNFGIRDQGWKLNFKRFRIYLEKKYDIKKAYLLLAMFQEMKVYIPHSKTMDIFVFLNQH